jgi:hypothetical protein
MIKNIPNAFNKIKETKKFTTDKPEFEIKIWEDNELIYHNKAYAGVINLVQGEIEFDFHNIEDPIISGDSQVFGFGKPIEQLFALDQLRQKMQEVIKIAEDQIFTIIKKIKNEASTKSIHKS